MAPALAPDARWPVPAAINRVVVAELFVALETEAMSEETVLLRDAIAEERDAEGVMLEEREVVMEIVEIAEVVEVVEVEGTAAEPPERENWPV